MVRDSAKAICIPSKAYNRPFKLAIVFQIGSESSRGKLFNQQEDRTLRRRLESRGV